MATEDRVEESSGRLSPLPSDEPQASLDETDLTTSDDVTQISKPSLSSLARDESLDVSVDDEDLLLVCWIETIMILL